MARATDHGRLQAAGRSSRTSAMEMADGREASAMEDDGAVDGCMSLARSRLLPELRPGCGEDDGRRLSSGGADLMRPRAGLLLAVELWPRPDLGRVAVVMEDRDDAVGGNAGQLAMEADGTSARTLLMEVADGREA
ncbi:hypothetical protein ACLOJK_039057 [Asimina triloba]